METDHWVTASHKSSKRSEQGWKLHVAAGVLTAQEVLARSLPPLLEEDAHFKVLASVRQLAALNDGRGGLSQVGKFITVYPNDDAQAVRLASALDEATEGLRGPAIPSDRALRPQSLVHYRYGGFGALQVRTQLGELLSAIRMPDGTLVPDRRSTSYRAPAWVEDPFVAAGIVQEPAAPSRTIGTRYVIIEVLHTSPRSQVYLCLDLNGPKRCVVKRVADDGNGGLERLRRESAVLSRLAADPRFPRPIELLEDAGGLCLAMEDVDGQTIDRRMASLRERNLLPSADQLVRWAGELAGVLEAIHANGLIYGDLKAPNVIVPSAGHLHLVDFELAQDRHDAREDGQFALGRGTRGYMSPQQAVGEVPAVADDVYSLGALLYLIATGAEPSFAPDPSSLLDRPIRLMNPALGPALSRVIRECLDHDPDRRFASPTAVATALADALETDSGGPPALGEEHNSDLAPAAEAEVLDLARRIGDLLCDGLPPITSNQGAARLHQAFFDEEQGSLDLNTGAGGAILALAELVAEFDDPVHREALWQGARWLTGAPRPAETRLPGLYVGEAGIAAALLRAGQVLGDADLIVAAEETGRSVASAPHTSPDLFNGTAGRLRFHLWLWEETADRPHLDDAIAAGDHLLALADARAGEVKWTIPAGYDRLSERTLTGYAHGAAGIGDVLLDLFETTGDGQLLEAARGVARWLERLAEPALEGDAGLNWPADENGRPTMAFWCHGAAGIARFLVHLGQVDDRSEAVELARAAALVVARGTRWSGVTQCHGLAGNLECLLDLYQATGEEIYLREAGSMARLVRAFAVERDGRLKVITDLNRSNPGFSTGCAGVAACLLRLAHPLTRAHLLSLRGFDSATPHLALNNP